MNKRIKIGLIVGIICLIISMSFYLTMAIAATLTQDSEIPSIEDSTLIVEQQQSQAEVEKAKALELQIQKEKELKKYKNKKIKYIKKEYSKYSKYMPSKNKQNYKNNLVKMKKAKSKKSVKKYYIKAKANIKVGKTIKKRFWNTGPTNFKSSGTIYYNGHRFTYYSSRVLHHYRTSEWTPDNLGFYRDSQGYLVVAADFISQGSIINTPWGKGKKYDCGAGSNTVDMYVNW